MEGEKMVAKVIRVHASKYPIEGEKSNSNSNFPIYLYIYIHTHSMWIVDKFSLLSSRIEDRRRGTKQIARIDQISLVYKRSSGVKR